MTRVAESVRSPRPLRAGPLPAVSVAETLDILARVVTPNVAKGVVIRRPRMVGLAGTLDLDRRAVEALQRLRNRDGSGPLMLRVPGLDRAVILDPGHVRRIPQETPEPFSPASTVKRAALSHFEPRVALISEGAERADRRRFNERVLDSDHPVHRIADAFLAVVEEEAVGLLRRTRSGELDWDAFSETWFRVVRRVVFGDGAAGDQELRELLDCLRGHANWAFLAPRRHDLRGRFLERLDEHLARAEPGSLAHVVANTPKTRTTAPDHQVPQWLFAFDPAGMTTFRALALLATHPEQATRAREEIAGAAGSGRAFMPFLRATVLESLRLWPTTPMVLRQTMSDTHWEEGVMPKGTGVLIFAPFFHRDDQRIDFANRFAPDVWIGDHPELDWPLIPFSGGPGICPGRNLVLLVTSAMVAALVESGEVRLDSSPGMDPGRRLPGTLNHYGLRFTISPRA